MNCPDCLLMRELNQHYSTNELDDVTIYVQACESHFAILKERLRFYKEAGQLLKNISDKLESIAANALPWDGLP